MKSINPATGELVREYAPHSRGEVERRIARAQAAFAAWREVPFARRAGPMRAAAAVLRARKEALAVLMREEMGKPLADGAAEVEKCAAACEYYAEHAEALLRDEVIATEARRSFVTYQPMPWNFPFWQVFRFAAPHLMAGNVGLLKHASNVTGCALAIEEVFAEAGFAEGIFSALLVPGSEVESVIAHPLVRAVTLTGSTFAGKAVASAAGAVLKKSVLELGGSDPYVVLADADVAAAAVECAKSRLINAGQSCIAAKRFIVLAPVCEAFERHFIDYFRSVPPIAPMARADLRDALHAQVMQSVAAGAVLRLGGAVPEGPGAFYPPTVLSGVKPGMAAFDEDLFGPVAAIIEAKDEGEAFALANRTAFGLGSAIFTGDVARGEALARTRIEAGQTFVNALVRSDVRLPFGGVKESGYGRELSALGIREFVNAKTVYIA
jgi:succinate-semialdehyde dehydrogenase/glutarate-semialdehyde dehydrogenase